MSVFTLVRPAAARSLPPDSATPMFARIHPHSLRVPATDAPAYPRNGADPRRLKIGLMGGSFNPAHDGHRHIAETALKRLGLDEVWWLVSPQNPLKSRDGMAPFQERLASAQRVARNPRIKPKDFELRMGTHFTADTLVELRRRCPRMRFVWIMGADNMIGFHQWERSSLILHTTVIAVFDRPSYSLRALASRTAKRYGGVRVPEAASRTLVTRKAPAWTFLPCRLHPASATQIRRSRQHGGRPDG